MKTENNTGDFACKLLIFLQALLGIGAVFGGLGLSIDPGGALLRMPIVFLEHTPFHNYLVPGLILLVVLGILPLIITWGLITTKSLAFASSLNLFKDKHWSWAFSLYTGFTLITWITIQVFLIQRAGIIHVVYIFWGLLIQVLTLLPSVQKHYTVERPL